MIRRSDLKPLAMCRVIGVFVTVTGVVVAALVALAHLAEGMLLVLGGMLIIEMWSLSWVIVFMPLTYPLVEAKGVGARPEIDLILDLFGRERLVVRVFQAFAIGLWIGYSSDPAARHWFFLFFALYVVILESFRTRKNHSFSAVSIVCCAVGVVAFRLLSQLT